MKHISSIASGVALGSAGLLMMSVITGCEAPQEKQQNKFLIIEQQTNGKYVVIEEMPTDGPSRAIIREKDANGNTVERFMNEAEMKALAEQEYQKVQNGTSETTQQNSGGEGMGLAGTILAVAAGSLMGNMIGNALMKTKASQETPQVRIKARIVVPRPETRLALLALKKVFLDLLARVHLALAVTGAEL